MLPICKAFVCLPFYKRLFHIPLQSSWGGTRPLSVSSSSILSFIQTYNILLSTSRQQRPGCPQYGNQRFHNSMDLQPMTTSYCRHSPFLSREGNVPHAFLCYTDRLEVCGWRVDKERFYKKAIYNILLLSFIPTQWILLSTTSQRLAVPLSLQNGKRVACFPFLSL